MSLRRASRATNEVPAQRMKAERERLTALAIPAAGYPLRMAVTVRTTGSGEYERIPDLLPGLEPLEQNTYDEVRAVADRSP